VILILRFQEPVQKELFQTLKFGEREPYDFYLSGQSDHGRIGGIIGMGRKRVYRSIMVTFQKLAHGDPSGW